MGSLYCQDNARYRQFIGNSMGALIEQAEELKDAILNQTGIIPESIKVGEDILGVIGTFTGDADAIALDIAEGKIAYVNGVKITGKAGIAEYALTIDGTGGSGIGSVTVDGDDYTVPVDYKAGSEVELVATADAGSVFVKWTVNAVDVSEEATFTYTMPTQATTVVAVFDLE